MILFWLICAGLLVIALAFLLPTLLERSKTSQESSEAERKQANIAVYRDQLAELKLDLQNGIVSQEQFDQDTEEIERRVLEDMSTSRKDSKITSTNNRATGYTTEEIERRVLAGLRTSRKDTKTTSTNNRATAYTVALAIPLIAVVFYMKVGSPQAVSSAATVAPESAPMMGGAGQRTQAQIEANVQKLADKLKANPSDAAGWVMLARSYNSMQRYGEATGAYAKATELSPNDADLWAEYAFATAMAGDRKLEGKATELINQALKVDPDNAKALQLSGTAAFEAKDYKKAIEIWQKVLSRVPAGSDVAQAITERINEAKTLSGSK